VILREEFHRIRLTALTDQPDPRHTRGVTTIRKTRQHHRREAFTTTSATARSTGRRAADSADSGTTDNPRAPRHSGGGTNRLKAMLDRVPWSHEETTVVVAPMFHSGASPQLIFAAVNGRTVVNRRQLTRNHPRTYRRHQATGLCVVAGDRFSTDLDCPTTTTPATAVARAVRPASGSRMRARRRHEKSWTIRLTSSSKNNYNATEPVMIATAQTRRDLRRRADLRKTR